MKPNERTKLWRINNPEKSKANSIKYAKLVDPDKRFDYRRKSHLKRKFGITLKQYDELFHKQEGCCAVCSKHRSEFDREFAVDHNAKTKEIRGLLCFFCNFKLVADYTDGLLLRKIADYVESGTGWFVLDAENTSG